MTLALLRRQLFTLFLIFLLGGIRLLWFLTPPRPIFPGSQRHCAAQHLRGELVNDAGTFALPTFCHVPYILAWENAFPVVFDAPRPIFPESQRHCAAQHPRGELVNDAGTLADIVVLPPRGLTVGPQPGDNSPVSPADQIPSVAAAQCQPALNLAPG